MSRPAVPLPAQKQFPPPSAAASRPVLARLAVRFLKAWSEAGARWESACERDRRRARDQLSVHQHHLIR